MLIYALKKSLNGQNHSSSGSHHLTKKFPPMGIHLPLHTIWKTLYLGPCQKSMMRRFAKTENNLKSPTIYTKQLYTSKMIDRVLSS